jgi:murein DD-endopeptidase MepM/ murein hydrolase activator NlpD
VKRGETLGQIANRYDVAVNAITQVNAGLTTLTPGQEILVPGATPITVAIAPTTPRTSATQPTTRTTAPTPTAVRADIPLSTIKNKAVDVYQELKNSETDTRTKPEDKTETVVKAASKLLWPTDLRVVNQYYGWRHTGLDIDGDYANAIYASADGVVEIAGWNNGGYGLMIFIDHGNGFKTRYAHASKMFVKAGDTVKRGQVIAMVGTTGRSTGTHLHYEVYLNNRRVNPLTYAR